MAMYYVLRSASTKLKVCPLQSLTNGQLFKCSSVAGSFNFHHTFVPPLVQCPQKTITKQNVLSITPSQQPGSLMQNVKKFSLSAKQMASHGHDHTRIWTAEKALSIGLLGIVPTAFLFPCQFMDYLLAVMIVTHNHWGIEAIVLDYVRPILFGNLIPKIAHGAVYLMSIATLTGLLLFITNDVGIVNAIKQLWTL